MKTLLSFKKLHRSTYDFLNFDKDMNKWMHIEHGLIESPLSFICQFFAGRFAV